MANSSIHKIFMDNVQAIKNIQISNGEFHPNNEVDGENIGTNLDAMSSYMSGTRYINGTYSTQNNYKKLYASNQIATKYVDFCGNPSMETEFNPNGSYYAIEGMLAHNGRIFGKMCHSERIGKNLYKNIVGNKEQNIFKNGVKFFM